MQQKVYMYINTVHSGGNAESSRHSLNLSALSISRAEGRNQEDFLEVYTQPYLVWYWFVYGAGQDSVVQTPVIAWKVHRIEGTIYLFEQFPSMTNLHRYSAEK